MTYEPVRVEAATSRYGLETDIEENSERLPMLGGHAYFRPFSCKGFYIPSSIRQAEKFSSSRSD